MDNFSFDEFVFDELKNARNKSEHGIGLDEFRGFDAQPVIVPDLRFDYGELRLRAFGHIAGEAHMIVFTLRQDRVRLISFRRAHEKEMRRHGR